MATLRVRLARFGGSRGRLGGQLDAEAEDPLLSLTLGVGAVPTAPAAQPAVPAGVGEGVLAVLAAVEGAVYVALGPAPDPTVEPRHLVLPGQPLRVRAGAGDRIAAVAAGDVALPALGAGLGALTALPAPSANGTGLGPPPPGARGVRLYVPPGASVSFTVAAGPPAAPPAAVLTVGNPATGTGPANWDEDLAGGQAIYVTAASGAPLFRWY